MADFLCWKFVLNVFFIISQPEEMAVKRIDHKKTFNTEQNKPADYDCISLSLNVKAIKINVNLKLTKDV